MVYGNNWDVKVWDVVVEPDIGGVRATHILV